MGVEPEVPMTAVPSNDDASNPDLEENPDERKRKAEDLIQANDISESGSPPAVTVQFAWGRSTFLKQDTSVGGRPVYQAKGSLDGKGGLTLKYNPEREKGAWEIASQSGGCLYFLESDSAHPGAHIGHHPWSRVPRGVCHLTLMQSALTPAGGWVDPELLAYELPF
mmetsp:Transcript_27043/g.58880  ORF Transcript_27043/g.58880 Transcript_27043/m.58880 type:complete len:166 (-) Transcript_27043:573-1070(-)